MSQGLVQAVCNTFILPTGEPKGEPRSEPTGDDYFFLNGVAGRSLAIPKNANAKSGNV